MRVLITGATGFVGSYLADELARVHPDAALWGTAHGHEADPDARPAALQLLPCDLTDRAATEAAVATAQPDRVFHLAGFAATARGDAGLVRRINVEATTQLLDVLVGAGKPCRVLLASSGYVYGPTAPGRPAREDDPIAPRGTYAESKAAMETEAHPFARSGVVSLVVARAFNHTGPRQTTDFVVPAFARQIARIERGRDEPIVRVGSLTARRDFLDVRDVVRAYRLLLAADAAPWRVVNVASGKAVTIQALLDLLIAQAAVPLRVAPDPARLRPSDLPECAGDPARLQSLTGWQPEIPLADTIARTLEWWRRETA